jgi:hypothetical protein
VGLPGQRARGAAVKRDESLLRVERANGLRRASVRDFHSLRITWVTLALTAGVPLELVQRVTGHKTTDVVLKHYFRPGQEDFRQALEGAMPKLLTTGEAERVGVERGAKSAGAPAGLSVAVGSGAVKEEMRALIATVRPVALRERLLKVWAKLQARMLVQWGCWDLIKIEPNAGAVNMRACGPCYKLLGTVIGGGPG